MADIKLIFAQDQNKYNDGDSKGDGKGSLLKRFFIDNPQTFINLVSETPNGSELKRLNDFYNGKSSETEIIEILRNVNNMKDNHKFANQCLHQDCVLGYIKNGSEYKGILNKKGEIKYLDKHKHKQTNKDKLEALYEPFSLFRKSKKEPKPKNEEEDDDEDEDDDSSDHKSTKAKKLSLKDQFTKYNKKMTMSLKKLKSTVGLPDVKSMNINFNSILGQIVDNSEKYTRGLIMESEEYKQKLILIKPTKVIKGVPVFAILTTD
jgi:hypothetical protein